MINASFVFGLDADDASTFDRTVQWVVENKIETVTSHIATPYPGTPFYERMRRDGRIIDHDLSHYDTAHVVMRPSIAKSILLATSGVACLARAVS